MGKCVVVLSARPNFERLEKVRTDVDKKFPVISVSPTIPTWFSEIPDIEYFQDDYFLERDILQKTNLPRKKWYYQQFLKYEIILRLIKFSQVHIIDGDSILDKKLYFDHNSRYTPIKINPAYNCYLKNLGINPRKTNFITNEMSFKRTELLEMLAELDCTRDNYIEQLSKSINEDCWFSEYQIYAIFKIENKRSEATKIKVFRRYDLIPKWMIKNLERRYSLIAFETHHSKTLSRKLRAVWLYLLNRNLG